MEFKVRRKRVYSAEDVPEGWMDSHLLLWQEDDAPVPDKERVNEALIRMAGPHLRKLVSVDLGDCFGHVYSGGWVVVHTPEGGYVGVLVELFQ